jgi:hypothetical protein
MVLIYQLVHHVINFHRERFDVNVAWLRILQTGILQNLREVVPRFFPSGLTSLGVEPAEAGLAADVVTLRIKFVKHGYPALAFAPIAGGIWVSVSARKGSSHKCHELVPARVAADAIKSRSIEILVGNAYFVGSSHLELRLRHNAAAQWRAAQGARLKTETQSARPLKQPGYAVALP